MKHIHFETIDSTNTWAKNQPGVWDLNGITLITADEQTAGRGRYKRHWVSPPNVNLYATFAFLTEKGQKDIANFSQVLALSCLQSLPYLDLKIKWPNDIFLNGKKIAGILCETMMLGNRVGVICGVGININMPKEACAHIDQPATSLMLECGKVFDIETILNNLKEKFFANHSLFLSKGFAPFFPLFLEHSYLKKGDRISVVNNNQINEGRVERFHSDCSLEMITHDGNHVVFYSGELNLN